MMKRQRVAIVDQARAIVKFIGFDDVHFASQRLIMSAGNDRAMLNSNKS